MNQIKSFLFITLLLMSTASLANTSVEIKCNIKNLEGEWVGTYLYTPTNTNFMMSLHITDVKKCDFGGTLHWPDFYNTKTRIEGNGENMRFTQVELIQGYHQTLGEHYDFQVTEEGKITGTYKNENGDIEGEFTLTRLNELSIQKQKSFNIKKEESAKNYGIALLKGEVDGKDASSLFQEIVENDQILNISNSEFLLRGKAYFNEIAFNLTYYYKSPNLSRIEMEVFGQQFFSINRNDSVWEYDPFEKVVNLTFENGPEQNDFYPKSTKQLLIEGYQAIKVENVQLDSLDTYRFTLSKEDELIHLFFNKKNNQLVRSDNEFNVMLYFNYQNYSGHTLPSLVYNLGNDDNVKFEFITVDFDADFDDSLFILPEEYQHLVVVEQAPLDETYYNKGVKLYKAGKYDEALDAFNKAIAQNHLNVGYLIDRGNTYRQLEDYYSAISDYDLAIELDPTNVKALNLKGLCIYEIGDYENAIPILTRAIELDSTYQDAYTNRGYAYYFESEFEKSLEDFMALTRLDSLNGEYFYLAGYLLDAEENYDTALVYLNNAIRLGYEDEDVWNRKGIVEYALKKYEDALTSFENAISFNENDVQKLSNAGNTLIKLEEYEKSKVYFEKAIELDKENNELYADLASAYYKLDQYQEAISYLNEAIKLNNQEAAYYDNRAYAKFGLMDYTGAIEDFSTSIDLYSNDPEIYYQRGLLKILINNQHDGCRDLRRAHELGHKTAGEDIEEKCFLIKEDK